jgi:DNA polymerase-1
VIATLVRTAKDKKVKAVVSSLDKDLMQLVEDPRHYNNEYNDSSNF